MCEEKGLLAGFGKVDVTPDYPTGLGGYSNAETRQHEGVVENIFTTCIALTDGEETILLFTLDNCSVDHNYAELIRGVVTPVTGIPGEKIFCAATHTHSAPSWGGYANGQRYKQDLLMACVQAAREALADRAPAKLLAAKKDIFGMNFVRHNITANGTYAGSNFGTFKDNPAVGYATEPDRQLLLVKFQREGKKSITMINWQGHPDCARAAGFENITSGYPGPMRDTLALLTGDLTAFFTGADGNTNITTRVKADSHGLNWREYGVKMAQVAYELYADLQEVEGTGIATRRMMVEAEIDHSWDHMLEQANEVFDLWKTVGKPEGDALGATYGFTSSYQARAIRARAKMDKTRTLELNAFRVGGVGFTTGTYEMFSDAGIFMRANSPYAFTFFMTGNSGYIPSYDAFNYRCYEADTGFFARGTAEMLADKYLEMLKEIQ
jgi:hypothetical protein